MNANVLQTLATAINAWTPPHIPDTIPYGDMPGDKVQIGPEHIAKANTIFPALVPMAAELAQNGRVVITVCGGSGVGKSEIASLLSHYFRTAGVGSYTLSGDNYPKRIWNFCSQSCAARLVAKPRLHFCLRSPFNSR